MDLAAVAAALIFAVAVLRSRAVRPLTPQLTDFGTDDEDFGTTTRTSEKTLRPRR